MSVHQRRVLRRRLCLVFRRRKLINHPYICEWSDSFQGWTRGFVHKNFWRVEHYFCTEADAMQECGLIFTKVRNKYALVVNKPSYASYTQYADPSAAWIMMLYQRAVINAWNTFAVKDRLRRENLVYAADLPSDSDQADIVAFMQNDWGGADFNDAPSLIALLENPRLHRILYWFARLPAERKDAILSKPSRINARLCRLAGVAPDFDVVQALREIRTAE